MLGCCSARDWPHGHVLRGGSADVPAAALLARARMLVQGRLVALMPVTLPVPVFATLAGAAAPSAPRPRNEGLAAQALTLTLLSPCLGKGGGGSLLLATGPE